MCQMTCRELPSDAATVLSNLQIPRVATKVLGTLYPGQKQTVRKTDGRACKQDVRQIEREFKTWGERREREKSYSPRVTAEEPGRVLGEGGAPLAV